MSTDNPTSKYSDLSIAMEEATHLEQRANEAKAHALELDAKERAIQAEIARATELSVANNVQRLSQQTGWSPKRITSSQEVGAIVSSETIQSTPVRFNGVEISHQQGLDMVETGQWTESEFKRSVGEAMQLYGYAVPPSFK
ncbi:hypothetical protein [Agrobacterium vaccinii]|uniref:hypothetical protein n=1 Tax=Agrobacterium vaccinii TaxID=2735528 RepID=UPI001E527FC0|nr:hypothetical protein [Agrobacterium vaccinii]UHS55507.1 hypothetical protein HRS00_01055 [Agrobacterium vaccinii]